MTKATDAKKTGERRSVSQKEVMFYCEEYTAYNLTYRNRAYK
jgi:hypothetical protein